MSLEDLLLNQIHLQISRWFVQQDVWLSKKLISKFDLSFFRYESRGMTIDVEAELARYRGLSTKIRPFVTETGASNSKQWIFPQLTTERFSSTYINRILFLLQCHLCTVSWVRARVFWLRVPMPQCLTSILELIRKSRSRVLIIYLLNDEVMWVQNLERNTK